MPLGCMMYDIFHPSSQNWPQTRQVRQASQLCSGCSECFTWGLTAKGGERLRGTGRQQEFNPKPWVLQLRIVLRERESDGQLPTLRISASPHKWRCRQRAWSDVEGMNQLSTDLSMVDLSVYLSVYIYIHIYILFFFSAALP